MFLGRRPDGYNVYINPCLIPPEKSKEARHYLVEKYWLDKGIEINNWFKIRTNPFGDDYVFVEAETREDALKKYLSNKDK